MKKTVVTIWNENHDEKHSENVRNAYPDGVHSTLAAIIDREDYAVYPVTMDMPRQGLETELLRKTDILVWYGHNRHEEVEDKIVEEIIARVHEGMGLILLHSSLQSKLFKRLLGVNGNVRWREAGEKERLWITDRSHPITKGLPAYIDIPKDEMYSEPFDFPKPDDLVFVSWFEGGEVFRSGSCYKRGAGKIFYFSPGHAEYPVYAQDEIKRIIRNAIEWAKPTAALPLETEEVQPLEQIGQGR